MVIQCTRLLIDSKMEPEKPFHLGPCKSLDVLGKYGGGFHGYFAAKNIGFELGIIKFFGNT
jgi:hypothetical protein